MNRLGVLTIQLDVRFALGGCLINIHGCTVPCEIVGSGRPGEYKVTTADEVIYFYANNMYPLGQSGIMFNIEGALDDDMSCTIIVPSLSDSEEEYS